jgi:hypothetical protein
VGIDRELLLVRGGIAGSEHARARSTQIARVLQWAAGEPGHCESCQ